MTLKNVPATLLASLKREARRNRRSLNQQAIHLLSQGIGEGGSEEAHRERRTKRVQAWRRLAGTWESDETTPEEIGAILKARTAGRDVPR